MVRRIFIDTNVFAHSYIEETGASRQIVNASSAGLVGVVTSQRLLEEVDGVFRKLYGRREAFELRTAILLFPRVRVVDPLTWGRAIHLVEPHIRDKTDAPHFAAARASRAAVFVTFNRRSVLPSMFDLVPIATPEVILPAIKGDKSWPSPTELLEEWERWAAASRRSPRGRR